MAKFIWVREDVVLAIHAMQICEHGGQDGVRDIGLLQSALSRPVNRLAYNPKAKVEELAASYCFGIINNHPFVDGNKRTGYVVMNLFLELNGFLLSAAKISKYEVIMKVASGKMSEVKLAEWLKSNIKR